MEALLTVTWCQYTQEEFPCSQEIPYPAAGHKPGHYIPPVLSDVFGIALAVQAATGRECLPGTNQAEVLCIRNQAAGSVITERRSDRIWSDCD